LAVKTTSCDHGRVDAMRTDAVGLYASRIRA
jgi:hypothetical protein